MLIAARPRPVRLAGLGVWAAGAAILAVYLAPSGHHRAIVAAGVLGVLAAIGLAFLLRRWPWALAVLTAVGCVSIAADATAQPSAASVAGVLPRRLLPQRSSA